MTTAIEEIATVRSNGSILLQHPELKAGARIKVILLLDCDRPAASPPPPGSKLRQDWAGGLAELASDYTSVELQHRASEWRGD